jgi:hypothetical protein
MSAEGWERASTPERRTPLLGRTRPVRFMALSHDLPAGGVTTWTPAVATDAWHPAGDRGTPAHEQDLAADAPASCAGTLTIDRPFDAAVLRRTLMAAIARHDTRGTTGTMTAGATLAELSAVGDCW